MLQCLDALLQRPEPRLVVGRWLADARRAPRPRGTLEASRSGFTTSAHAALGAALTGVAPFPAWTLGTLGTTLTR